MPSEKNQAIARALVNLFTALAELDQPGKPWITVGEGRKYVVLAIRELIALSPDFDGVMPDFLNIVGRQKESRSAPLEEDYPGSEGKTRDPQLGG